MKIWIPRFVEQNMVYCAISRLCIFSTLNYNLCSFTFGIGLNYCSHFSQCLTICVWRAKFQMWASVHMTSVHNFHTYGKVLLNLKYLPSQTSGCCKGLWKPVIEINVFEKCQNKFKLSKFGKWDYDRWKVIIWNSPVMHKVETEKGQIDNIRINVRMYQTDMFWTEIY